MRQKIIINDYDDFRRLEGQDRLSTPTLSKSPLEGIQDFCRGTLNDEWIHWDRERCKESPLGDLIAPGLYLPALFPNMFWQVMEINIPRMIVKGIDRIRILKPVTIGSQIVGTRHRRQGPRARQGHRGPLRNRISISRTPATRLPSARFINRYWD